MKTTLLSLAFTAASFVAFAQPQYTDMPSISDEDIVISVIEGTEGCDTEPGIYQLEGDGYNKIMALEALPSEDPEQVMAKNSQKVFDTLKTIGAGRVQVRDYREFWIDECSKQSQYVLVDRRKPAVSASLLTK